MRTTRRGFLRALAAAGIAAAVPRPAAAGPPCAALAGRTVRWIVPTAPGGGLDTTSRLLVPQLSRVLGTEIVIENVPGAGAIVGATRIRNAPPDGGTIGVLNAPALLVTNLIGETAAPNPASDFTILGRIARSRQVWATGGRSPLRTMDDVLERARRGPIVFAVEEVSTPGFLSAALAASLLHLDAAFVAGFSSGRDTALAAVRGDVDLVSFTFESILDRIESGDLRPLLQISATPVAEHPSLRGVPLLGGPGGLAAREAARLGQSVEEAQADAGAAEAILGAGRLVVAPLGLPPAVLSCLEEGLFAAASSPEFVRLASASERSVEATRGPAAVAELRVVRERAARFLPAVRAAVERARRP